jgi:uncharacterized protein (DUF952 family)
VILHLVAAEEWEAQPLDQPYVPPSLAQEGFIHCTADEATLLAVANAFYRDVPGDVLVLEIDELRLASEVRREPADPTPPPGVSQDVRFPHVFGPIERHAIVRVRRTIRDTGGAFLGYEAEADEMSTTRGSSPSARRTRPW